MKTENKRKDEQGRQYDDYEPILSFAKEHNNIDYIRFDYYTVGGVGLFAVHENFDFDTAESIADTVIKVLPAIKRIFAKPVIHLKDSSEILPVESVRIVNSKTMTHASVHSELWENKTVGGIKPRKLLTINNQDNYAIYENIAFAKAIDIIMLFLRRNMRILRELMYANKSLEFNLLDRTNHLNYYLAIGKLHTGYIRNYDTYYEAAERCLSKMNYIYNVINARLERPVYKKCRKLTGGFTLKSTNILMMHKDYHKIYQLLKYFSSVAPEPTDSERDRASLAGYYEFCEMLTLFAVGNFGFSCGQNDLIDFFALDMIFRLGNVSLNISSVDREGTRAILLEFDGGGKYRILLVPAHGSIAAGEGEGIGELRGLINADEYIYLTPDPDSEGMYISISNIESFRRIQQTVLRGMIYADTEKARCPFCSQKLARVADPVTDLPVYECKTCRTVIKVAVCPETRRNYYLTYIRNFSPKLRRDKTLAIKDSWEYKKQLESSMHFRNITDYNGVGFVCPHCGKVH